MNHKAVLIVGLVLILTGLSVTANKIPRGIRNKNPTNIRKSSTDWAGELAYGNGDADFEEFESSFFGLRAAARILSNYLKNYGIKTVAGISARWAPITENNTAEHASTISSLSGFGQTQVLDLRNADTLALILKGMVRAESGRNLWGGEWFSDQELKSAAKAALS